MTNERSCLLKAAAAASAQCQHHLERIIAECEYAEGLCALHPDRADAWRPLVAKAEALVRGVVDKGHLEQLRAAVHEAESVLTPLGETAKSHVVYGVGHGHIDMNWMWSWPETVAVTHDTFSTVLRLMEEYPEFHFSQSQASVYEIVERYNPALLERIRARVQEGRWEVTASHWVENDANMAGGESLCRHVLYTRQYMEALFGLKPEDVAINWAPDTFGHAATIPTYLSRAGIRRYYCCRPGQAGPPRPPVFWWEAPDGSRVLVCYERGSYNGKMVPAVLVDKVLAFARETGFPGVMHVYGVGDHGGGPTRRDLLAARDMVTWPIFPRLELSTTRPFYEMLEADGGRLPVFSNELNFQFTGCYTTQSQIKKANAHADHLLAAAEAAAVAAWAALGRPYPAAELRKAWRDTIFSHFHDILPGSGIHDTRTYCHAMFQDTAAATGMIQTLSLRELAAAVDTSDTPEVCEPALPASQLRSALGAGVGFESAGGAVSHSEQSAGDGPRPILVFNPSAFERRETVVATIWDNDPARHVGPQRRMANLFQDRSFAVRTPGGAILPAQIVETGGYWGHQYGRYAFPVEVGSLGYAVYTLFEREMDAGEPAVRTFGRFGMENERLRVEIDPVSGGIRELVDRASGLNLVDPARPAALLDFFVERPHGMSAWNQAEGGRSEGLEVVAIRRTAQGPYLTAVAVDLRLRESTFTVTFELRAAEGCLHLKIDGNWLEHGSPERGVPVLRLNIPLALAGAKGTYEIPFGAIERPECTHGEEVPALRWARIDGKVGKTTSGCLLLNDCKHGHSLDGNALRLTLIRSAYEPDPLPEIGGHRIRLALAPFAGTMTAAEATRRAVVLNQALRLVGTDIHAGDLPTTASFLRVAPESVVLSGIKQAEDGHGLILRLYETAGAPATAELRFDTERFGAVAAATEVDLMERPLAASTAESTGATVRVRVPALGIASVRATFRK